MKKIMLNHQELGGTENLFFIAGPCVIENEDHAAGIAEKLVRIFHAIDRPFIFKASYDKANRTSLHSFRGPGFQDGIQILHNIKKTYDVPILTDVHDCSQVEGAASVADIIQIPAFLCRQTDLLLEAGRSRRIVNIKKGQFLAPHDMINVVEKILSTGNENIILTERGYSFGYNNLVVDFRNFSILRDFGYPVVFDATHSVQLPGGVGKTSGGNAEHIIPLSQAAVACGVDGLFFEVHDNPTHALCDGPNALDIRFFETHVRRLLTINHASHGGETDES